MEDTVETATLAGKSRKSSNDLFSGRERINMRAYYVAQRLNLKALERNQRIASSPFVMNAGLDGFAVMFKYGVVVLFGLDAVEEAAYLENLKIFMIEPLDKVEVEEVDIVIDNSLPDGIDPDHIHLRQWSIEHIQIIADIFATSAVLSYYETHMAELFDRIEPVGQRLQHGGPSGKEAHTLLKHIGDTLSIQRKMIGQVEVDDKPDILWDNPQLERFYLRLEDEYELKERHRAVKEKLDMIYRTAETLLGMLQNKRSLRVEWYIVLLIIFDIVYNIIEKIIIKFF
jgi:uncharacterized Rmd1/YagE family protein